MTQTQDAQEQESAKRGSDFNLSSKTLIHLGSEVFVWAFIFLIPYLSINRLYGSEYLGMTGSLIAAMIFVLLQTLFKVIDSETEKTGLGKWIEVLVSIVTLVSALIVGSLIDSTLGMNFSTIGPNLLFAAFSAVMYVILIAFINSRRTTPLVPFVQSRETSRSNILLIVLVFIIFIMNAVFIGSVWILTSSGISSIIVTPLLSAACFILVTAPLGFAYFMIRYDWDVNT